MGKATNVIHVKTLALNKERKGKAQMLLKSKPSAVLPRTGYTGNPKIPSNDSYKPLHQSGPWTSELST